MSDRVIAADSIVKILKDLDPADVDFVLAVVNASFPKGKPASQSGGSRQSTPGRGKKKASQPSPPTPPKSATTGGYGRGGGAGVPQAGEGPTPPAAAALAAEVDLTSEVLRKLSPITGNINEVSRDPSADKPKMTRKPVQQRLNKKRAELQRALSKLMASSVDGYWAFESLNAIQRFRLAAKDALATPGVRLRTDPIPPEFSELVQPILLVAHDREQEGEMSNHGFYSNNDNKYKVPEEHEDLETELVGD
jgi:hypothetical protein